MRQELAEIIGPCERHLAEALDVHDRRRRIRRVVAITLSIVLESLLASRGIPRPRTSQCMGQGALPECAMNGLEIGADPWGDSPRSALTQDSGYDAVLELIDDLLWETPRVTAWSDEQWEQYFRLRDALRQACAQVRR
ncbi:MAG: hypothetical protein AAF645_05885 [Myxococcota bacterium]